MRKVETNKYAVLLAENPDARCAAMHKDTFDLLLHHPSINIRLPAFCLPLQEVDVLINAGFKIPAILDTGSQINVIRQDIVQASVARAPANCQLKPEL